MVSENTYYCVDLEQNINFDHDKIAPCCPALLYTQYAPPSIPYNGGEFPLQNFLNMREQVKKDIQNGTSPCLKCLNLVKEKPIKNTYLFHTITINHFKYCNARCSYCDFWIPSNQEKYKTKYKLYEILQCIFKNNLMDPQGLIVWGGGEPTIYEEFPKIINLLISKKIQTMVNTNCIVFSQPLYDAIHQNCATMQLSLDCGDKETYIKIKGRDKFNDVIANLKKYATPSTNNITLKYIINDTNNSTDQIIKFLDISKNLKIFTVNLSSEANESVKETISDETFHGIKTFLLEAKKRHIKVTILRTLFGDHYLKQLDDIYINVYPKSTIIINISKFLKFLSPNLHTIAQNLYNKII
jgi:MoaA/NifB/PqqE/SkfB family radical SAM enzyme